MPKKQTNKRKTKKNIKNKTIKFPKNFCKTSLKTKNVKNIKNATCKLVCTKIKNDKSKKCKKECEKNFDKGYLDKCKKRMKILNKYI